jgi:hypothetical protein
VIFIFYLYFQPELSNKLSRDLVVIVRPFPNGVSNQMPLEIPSAVIAISCLDL